MDRLYGLLLAPLAVALREPDWPEHLGPFQDPWSTTTPPDGPVCREQLQWALGLLRELNHRGVEDLDGNPCDWPEIHCCFGCIICKLDCPHCDGQLPQETKLDLWDVSLTSPKLTGDLRFFESCPQLGTLNLGGVVGSLKDLAGELDDHRRSIRKHRMRFLNLTQTNITGNLSGLTTFPSVEEVDLSYTQVSGNIDAFWIGKVPHLRNLRLANSRVRFIPPDQDRFVLKQHFVWRSILPKLSELDVTNCPINSPVEVLLTMLAMCPLTSVKAVNAGLYGEVPSLRKLKSRSRMAEGLFEPRTLLMTRRSLLSLDVSQNNISELLDLPVEPNLGRVTVRENTPLRVAPGLLAKALTQGIILDLSETMLLNQEEAQGLTLKITDVFVFRNETGGYACKDVVNSELKVTPSKFLPQQLCTCQAGWFGSGAACTICPENTFSDQMGGTCKSCPANSTAPPGSTKLRNCRCRFGDLHDGQCSCDKHQTLKDGNCILCSKLHLECNSTDSNASTAVPEVRYMRLEPWATEARRCLPPGAMERCPGSDQCGAGYSGTLCSSCADGFWPKRGRCQQCPSDIRKSLGRLVLLLLVGLAGALLASVFLRRAANHGSVRSLLRKQLLVQAPVLLQSVQLWSVLSELGRSSGGRLASEGLWELPYLETLQLTTKELQGRLYLQCLLDAEIVRTLAALSAPMAPVILLGCSSVLELCRPGLGVNVALQVLTLLFIGGASSTAELLKCQYQDGDDEHLGSFAFRSAVTHLRCSDGTGVGFWIDAVGYGCAVAYGVLIPLFIGFLMMRQYSAVQEARLFSAHAEAASDEVTLTLHTLEGQLPSKSLPKRLLAAAAAHLAVHCHGKRRVQLNETSITITACKEEETEKVQEAESSRKVDVLRCRRIAEMLSERIILDEASERLLIGSQWLLRRYSLSQDMWMFVAMKLFELALVSCVSMSNAWRWAVAFSLAMAVLVAVYQPYMLPQVTRLHSLSCFCLALASWSFVYDAPWLARVALLAPLLLMIIQAWHPDCTEAMAERLYQELHAELPKVSEGYEVEVKQLHLMSHQG